jgi:outer membrane protein
MGVRLVLALLLAVLAGPAFAQEPAPEPAFGLNGDDLVIELGGGAKVQPAYEGADDYVVTPWPTVSLQYLRLPGIWTFQKSDSGFFIGPSFGYVPSRDEDDNDNLEGLGDIGAAYEIGATMGYRYDMLRAFVSLRQGFGGHHGVVGEAGVDVIVDPLPDLTLSLGPRLSFADSDYLQTYLGVTASQSAKSGLPEFDPNGGIKGLGLEAQGRYSLTDNWSVVGKVGYEHLVGDAADSPVASSENEFTAALGLTYRFGLDLFK